MFQTYFERNETFLKRLKQTKLIKKQKIVIYRNQIFLRTQKLYDIYLCSMGNENFSHRISSFIQVVNITPTNLHEIHQRTMI